ncbi:MAG: hypothetical protein Q7J84_04550 [Sulfuricaulis sp.]|nr:hypothetical protein [Sulfuricaulis sp.]
MDTRRCLSSQPETSARFLRLLRRWAVGLLVLFALGAAPTASATSKTIYLPPETAVFEPGLYSGLVTQKCTVCHSADYPTTQPVQKQAGWQAVVDKMQNVFNMPPLSATDQANIVEYLVTHYGCQPVVISGFWPPTGSANTVVFVFGKYFRVPHGLPVIVRFNGLQTNAVQLIADDLLLALTPSGNATGPITVETDCGVATSPVNFGVPLSGVAITGLWPSQASVGGFVFVFGAGFDSRLGATQVDVNGTLAPLVQVVDPGLLIFFVPAGATSGPVHVTVGGVAASSPVDLAILP